jgi:hypothetical protein
MLTNCPPHFGADHQDNRVIMEISCDPIPHLVLQCASCRTIVGDTSEFACAASHDGLKLLVLRGEDASSQALAQAWRGDAHKRACIRTLESPLLTNACSCH